MPKMSIELHPRATRERAARKAKWYKLIFWKVYSKKKRQNQLKFHLSLIKQIAGTN